MGRKHVHFATKPFNSEEVISGARSTSHVLIYLDLTSALNAGLRFYLSDNDVLLTPDTVMPEHFADVKMM